MSARNYMQDIGPREEGENESAPVERSIRDFRPSAARVRLQTPPRAAEMHEHHEGFERPRRSRLGVWIAALISLVVLGGAAALILFSATTITVIPRTHILPFDATNPLTAYPSASAATGTIPYSVTTQVFEDSAVVQASGTEHAEEKATGNITIYNETNKEMRLIKNTRFQSADGLIFRVPASVDVPAMQGTKPGTLTATVFADQTGPQYNIAPQDRLTLPGLKSSPDYTKIYAKSTAAFTGGFSGDRPAVSPSVLEASKAEVRGRLNEKAQQLSKTAPEGSIAFPGLMAISYEALPPTNEAGGGVRIHERATITMPIFSADTFARSVAQAVSADAEGQSVSVRFSADTTGQSVGELSGADLGQQPITFTLSGRGQLVWHVDEEALTEALAGREEAAFETIIKGFPAVEEARARITPFWKHAFPQDAAKIKVTVEEPAMEF